jgi:hypothetical protein
MYLIAWISFRIPTYIHGNANRVDNFAFQTLLSSAQNCRRGKIGIKIVLQIIYFFRYVDILSIQKRQNFRQKKKKKVFLENLEKAD